jgi:hypothetical protein
MTIEALLAFLRILVPASLLVAALIFLYGQWKYRRFLDRTQRELIFIGSGLDRVQRQLEKVQRNIRAFAAAAEEERKKRKESAGLGE